MEVMNTRVCSKASPAPGNTGFDGCLELLSLECRARERALTVWDDASFHHIDKAGVCSSLRKQAMLHLSLPALRFLFKNMRSFTVCGEGREPPREVARAVIRSVGWGAKQVRITVVSSRNDSGRKVVTTTVRCLCSCFGMSFQWLLVGFLSLEQKLFVADFVFNLVPGIAIYLS